MCEAALAKTALDTNREWDIVYTSHANNFLRNTPTDNFYDRRPFLSWARKKKRTARGGQRLVEPLNHGVAAQGGSYGRGDQFSLVSRDPVTAARYEWAYYQEPVLIFMQDEHEAGGAGARLELVQINIQDAIDALMDKISEHLLATSQALTTDVIPLIDVVPVDPTVTGASLGGVDPSVSSWWQSKTDSTVTFSSGGLDAMRTMYNNCSAGGRTFPDLILTTQTLHEGYEDLVEGNHDIFTGANSGAGRQGDLGFGGGMMYKGTPLMWDADATSSSSVHQKLYFLNSEGLQLVEKKGRAFRPDPFQSMIPAGYDARGTIIRWCGQLVCRERRLQGQIDTVT